MVSQFAQFFNMQPTMIRLKDPVDSEISFIMVPVNNMQSMKEINVKFMKTPIKSICIDKERGGGAQCKTMCGVKPAENIQQCLHHKAGNSKILSKFVVCPDLTGFVFSYSLCSTTITVRI